MNFIVDLVIQDSLRASFYVFLVIFSTNMTCFLEFSDSSIHYAKSPFVSGRIGY